MPTSDFILNTSNSGRKRKIDQQALVIKKPRLDEGTSHPKQAILQLKKNFQRVIAKVINEMENSRDTFTYPPLKELHGQDIRVLVIEPGKYDDPVKCRLVPSALPNNALSNSDTKAYPYTAVSYYWGEGQPIHPVTITNYITSTKPMEGPSTTVEKAARRLAKHGKEWRESGVIYVRSNLYVALQRFRKKKKKVIFWIDALCIDQTDEDERSAQVKQMHELYIQAKNLKIWLGDGSTTVLKAPEESSKRCFNFLWKLLNLSNLDNLLKDLADGESDAREEARLVVQLMSNKWFSRRWIIQELALAPKAEVMYGKQKMLWSDFADAIAVFSKCQDRIGPVLSNMIAEEACVVAELRPPEGVKNLGANALVDFINNLFRRNEDGVIQHRMMNVETLVSNLLAFEATNPRDTIYAVLSLAKDTHNLSTETNANAKHLRLNKRLKADYKKSLLDVYAGFIEYCINQSQSLDIILRHWAPPEKRERPKKVLADRNFASGHLENKKELPTWMPSIQKSSFGTPSQRMQGRSNGDGFAQISIHSAQRTYNATLNFAPKKKIGTMKHPQGTPKWKRRKQKYSGDLFVKGIQIGSVKEVTARAAHAMIFRESFELAGFDHEWWQEHREWAEDMPRVPDRFWRTLVADRGPDGKNPPSWYPRACMECLNNLRPNGDFRPDDVIGLENSSSIAKDFVKRVKDVVWDRLIMSVKLNGDDEKMTYGLAPSEARAGDIICVFFGCSVPVVLRQRQQSSEDAITFLMIGECFVYGMMDGEAVGDREWAHPYDDAERFQIK